MPQLKTKPLVNTRIQVRNKELILDAALDIFSAFGFRGATVDQIAAKSEMSKPNLLYYFRRKEDIYVALLEHTLSDWLEPLRHLVAEKAPVIQSWIAAGKIAPVDPYHLIFAIWAVTQHYADFSVQVDAVLGRREDPRAAQTAVLEIPLRGRPGKKR